MKEKQTNPSPLSPRAVQLMKNLAFAAFFVVAAIGLGLYVFPTNQYIAWGLLFLCWLCFRLSLRAKALFDKRSRVTETVNEIERGTRMLSDRKRQVYQEWRQSERQAGEAPQPQSPVGS